LIRPLDRAQIFTVVSGGPLPCTTVESLQVEEQVLWRQTGITAEKGHKF
jgi:hypothetical protein